MRKFGIAVAISLSVIVAAMGFIAWHQVQGKGANVNVEVVGHARFEARQLFPMCEASPSAVASSVAEGTTHFPEYFATDPKQARKALVDVVIPSIDSRQLACTTTRDDFVEVVKTSVANAKDPYVDDAIPKVAATIAKLDSIHAAAMALRDALDHAAAREELDAKLAALLAATK